MEESSRSAQILADTLNGNPYEGNVQSRIEELLTELNELILSISGGSGTSNYNVLINLPVINGIEWKGEKNSNEFKIAGKIVTGNEYNINNTTYTAGVGAEIHNDYANNKSVGAYSTATGYNNTAIGDMAFVSGMSNTATGDLSVVFGTGNRAVGDYSTITGSGNTANGTNSFIGGGGNTANGNYSAVFGGGNVSDGMDSFACGCGTTATAMASFSCGKYNKVDTNEIFAFIIGNGTNASNKSNAMAIGWDGKIYIGNDNEGVDVRNAPTTAITTQQISALWND